MFKKFLVDNVFNAYRDYRCPMLDEIGCHVFGKTLFSGAAETETADQPVIAEQRNNGDADRGNHRFWKHWPVHLFRVGTEHRLLQTAVQFAEFRFILQKQQIGKFAVVDIQIDQNAPDVVFRIEQQQGDDIQFGRFGESLEYAVDQFTKAVGADEFQIEHLIAPHDLLVAVRLLQQIRQLVPQLQIFRKQPIR